MIQSMSRRGDDEDVVTMSVFLVDHVALRFITCTPRVQNHLAWCGFYLRASISNYTG